MAYGYVGPEAIRAAAASSPPGTALGSRADAVAWLAGHRTDRGPDGTPATFVVTLDGALRVASRRSEHVACAGGGDVLAAGEIVFDDRGIVVGVSNLSTGYCPEPASWDAVRAALDAAGIAHPGAYTHAFVFRRCPACGERNLVKDDHFACALCDAELPAAWNF